MNMPTLVKEQRIAAKFTSIRLANAMLDAYIKRNPQHKGKIVKYALKNMLTVAIFLPNGKFFGFL